MGAVPKRRISRTRRAKRRTHDNLAIPHLVRCENCGEMKRPHYMCPYCRTYNGRQILPEFEE
jgi:large subunit ribosomal protein L32